MRTLLVLPALVVLIVAWKIVGYAAALGIHNGDPDGTAGVVALAGYVAAFALLGVALVLLWLALPRRRRGV